MEPPWCRDYDLFIVLIIVRTCMERCSQQSQRWRSSNHPSVTDQLGILTQLIAAVLQCCSEHNWCWQPAQPVAAPPHHSHQTAVQSIYIQDSKWTACLNIPHILEHHLNVRVGTGSSRGGQDSSLTNYAEEKLDNILCWKCGRFVLN